MTKKNRYVYNTKADKAFVLRAASRPAHDLRVDDRRGDVHLRDGHVLLLDPDDLGAERAERLQALRARTDDPASDVARPRADQRHPQQEEERRLFAATLAQLIDVMQENRRIRMRRLRTPAARVLLVARQQPNVGQHRVVAVVAAAHAVLVLPFAVDLLAGQQREAVVELTEVGGRRLLSLNPRGSDRPANDKFATTTEDVRLHVVLQSATGGSASRWARM